MRRATSNAVGLESQKEVLDMVYKQCKNGITTVENNAVGAKRNTVSSLRSIILYPL